MTAFTTRQQEIIQAAVKLIATGGIQKLTMKNIAGQLHISEPAIYRHFQSKRDILLSMLNQFKQHSNAHLSKARSVEGTPMEQLEHIFLEHIGRFAEHPHMTAVVFSEEAFQDDSRLAEEVFTIMTAATETITQVIAEAQQHGAIRNDIPKEHLTLMLLGTLRLMVKRWRLSGYGFDLKQESRNMWLSLKTVFSV